MYDKIKEHLKYAITCYKKHIQRISEQQKFTEDNGGAGDHEFNCIMNAQDSITEYQKILNFVEECEDDWKWICGNGTKEIGVGKSNWGTLNYPNKENPLIVKKVTKLYKIDTKNQITEEEANKWFEKEEGRQIAEENKFFEREEAKELKKESVN